MPRPGTPDLRYSLKKGGDSQKRASKPCIEEGRLFRSERLSSFMLGPVEDRSPDPLARLPVVQV